MIFKNLKILIALTFFLYQNSVFSKTNDQSKFNHRYLSNYFSALISFDNNDNDKALKFFNSSKQLLDTHDNFLKEFTISLVENGKISKAIKQIKKANNSNQTDFYEAQILLIVDSLVNEDWQSATNILMNLETFQNEDGYSLVIHKILNSYFDLFKNNEIAPKTNENYGRISLITKAFQNCYIDSKKTKTLFENIINSSSDDYSRYLFFYISEIILNKDFEAAINISKTIDPISSSLLILQLKNWINNSKFENVTSLFSCKDKKHLLAEFFYLISNIYSADQDYKKSNFYLNISYFLNPNFYFNLSLLAENYFINENYPSSKKVLEIFSEKDEVYFWFKVKKNTQIFKEQKKNKEALNYLERNFKKINTPSTKIIFDMANFYKSFKQYDKAIKLYSDLLNKVGKDSNSYADILYRRGGSFERLKKFKKSDEDLLLSLKIKPSDPYVMNYLAYSWLERGYEIDKALLMLEDAYRQKENDPYIIDSIGWAYFLTKDYKKAEKYLIQAVQLMPDDPIVNDHYGDILWKLDKKIQARYFWKNTLKLKDIEEEMKNKIKEKILKGLDNI